MMVLASLLLATQLGALPKYKLMDLHVERSTDSIFINNAGTIVGTGRRTPKLSAAFQIKNEKLSWLPGLEEGKSTSANGITNNGTVYGSAFRGDSQKPVIWSGGKIAEIKGLPGGMFSASSANDRGDVLGSGVDIIVRTFEDTWKPQNTFYFWRKPSGILQMLPETFDHISSILDDRGFVYDTVQTGHKRSVVRFDGTTWEALVPPISFVCDINAQGHIAGGIMLDAETSIGVLWKDGVVTELSAPPVNAINNRDDMVGTFSSYSYPKPRGAFLLTSGEVVMLEKLVENLGDWKLTEATDINDKGEIVGWGEVGGKTKFFLMKPT